MAPQLGHIGPITIWTYTILLDIAVVAGLITLAVRGQRLNHRPSAWLDAGLLALAGGLIGARLAHVGLYWAYFSEHLDETYRLWLGGLDWHGAMLGGLLGLALGCRWRRVAWRQALDVLALLLPLGAGLAWGGCLAAACAYGQEIPSLAGYPVFIAAELPDLYGIVVPRLMSQVFGIALGVVLLGVALLLARLIRRAGLRFWIVLILLALGVFAIGFTRGDSMAMVGTLRLDQVLDLVTAALSLAGLLFSLFGKEPAPIPFPIAEPADLPSQGANNHAV